MHVIYNISPHRIESIKTGSMENVSTRVLEKIKNISEAKAEKWSDYIHMSKHTEYVSELVVTPNRFMWMY